MNNTLNIALSGANSASLRIENSANNIANAQSTFTKENGQIIKTPFLPKDVVQISSSNGGVIAYTEPSSKEPIITQDPGNIAADSNGLVSFPNIDIAEELVKIQEASFQFKANLKTIKQASVLLGALTDITA